MTNLAVDGDTSAGFLNKLNNDNTIQTAVKNSDIILVSIGGNDVLEILLNDIKTTLGLQPTATTAEIQAALSDPAKQGALVTWANNLDYASEFAKYNNAITSYWTNLIFVCKE